MNDVAEHEGRFHDHGEQVDEPYPRQSERPLRTGVAKIISNDGGSAYTITEQVWTGYAWTDGTAPGQYVSASSRDYNDLDDGAADDLVFFWEQYTQAGIVELIVAVGLTTGADEKVATACGETADYLENVTAGHDPWIVLTESGGILTWRHAGPGDTAHFMGCQGQCNLYVTYIDVDCWGHVRRWWGDANASTPGGCCGPLA